MGNRFSVGADASRPSLGPPPPPAPAATESPIETIDANPLNPGTYEELFRKIKEIEPQIFDGFKFMLNKPMSSHFQVSHTVQVCGGQGSTGYRFGAIYAGTNYSSPQEAYPLLVADIDPSGNVNGQVITQLAKRLRMKAVAQIQSSQVEATQFSFDYRAPSYTASLTAGQIDVASRQGLLVFHFLQSLTERLAIGSELVYQWSPAIPGGQIAQLGFGGKYSASDWTTSAQLSGSSCHLAFYRKIGELLQVGVDWETSLRQNASVASIGYQFDLQQAGVSFKGQVDTKWTVQATMEKKLAPAPITFVLSAAMNHKRNVSQFGIGLLIGQG